jgi:flagellin
VAFTINTNIASLQAQNYLNQTQAFQNQTINEVTSGDRIVNSGNDPSGLAIANAYRSNEAVLTQGIANANDGLSQLQIADGGVSNISQLLDSARTLATESASDTFTGDRGVLNQQFQSVLQEINRQAQSIGLNQGGSMAKALNVFIGGGESSGNITATQNGTVSVNLSNSTVDAKSLGLEGVVATGVNTAGTTDLGTGSATSVANILANTSNSASITNNTTNFVVTGPGFSNADGSGQVDVAVNLNGVTDTGTLVTAINQAIQNAGNGSTQESTAFRNANITASVSTNAANQQTLAFSSATTAFQVQGGDQVATALMGSFATGAQGNVANVTAAAATAFAAPTGNAMATAGQAYAAPVAAEVVNMQVTGNGLTGTAGQFTVTLPTTATTADEAVTAINAGIAANTALAATGLQAVNNSGTLELTNTTGGSFNVQAAGDVSNALGFGSWSNSVGVAGGAGNFNYTSLTGTAAGTATTQDVQVSLNGGNTIDLGTLTGTVTLATNLATLNAAFQANAATKAAGMTAVASGADINITSTSGVNFRLNFNGGTGDAFGFGDASANGSTSSTGSTAAMGVESVNMRINGMGLNGAAGDISVAVPTTVTTVAEAAAAINTGIAANAAVAATGVQAVVNGTKIDLVNAAGNSFTAQTAGDVSNSLGFGSWSNSAGAAGGTGTFGYDALTAIGVSNAATQNLQISINGGAATADLGPLTGTGVESTDIATLNAAFQGNATTRAAGMTAADNGFGKIEITASSGDNFRANFYGGTGDAFGFGASATGAALSTAGATSNYAAADSINSLGAQQSVNASGTDVYKFTGITDPAASQTITLTAVDANGAQHTLNVALNSTNAGNLDQAVGTINNAILSSNDSTLQQIGTFKQENNAGSAEGVSFMDAGGSFSVSLGATPNNVGIADGSTGLTGGTVLASASNGAGATANISNTASASAAVTALGSAVTTLGSAQAQIGIGENDFTYAVNLAQSQLTNFQAAESQIRDADLAQESANLTKSQIMLQAGVAALAQANSAPQQVLSLLQH